MFDKYNAIRSNNHQNLPLECMKNLQRGLGSVDLHAFLTTEDVSEKKPSRLTEVAFHPVRPWIASIEPRGVGIIWNYETKEVVNEFSLEFSYRETTTTSTTPEEEVIKAPTTILKSSSPTASSYVKTLRNKPSTLTMVFYDHEVIRHREGAHAERTCFDEWIIILAGTHVIIIDIHSNSAIRCITPEELQRQMPSSIEILPTGLLAIGCHDGKIRIWNPKTWRMVNIIDAVSPREIQHLIVFTHPTTHLTFLISANIDGKVMVCRISCSNGNCDIVKMCDLELREIYRTLDSAGFSEFKLHLEQEVLTATTKDGAAFLFDLFPLVTSGKSLSLMGILPSQKIHGASICAGPRRGAFTLVSFNGTGTNLTFSELTNKGRPVDKNNNPAAYHEYSVSSTWESKDLRVFNSILFKKIKLIAFYSSIRDTYDLCCVTNMGLLILKLTCFGPEATPLFVPRGQGKNPLLAIPLSGRVGIKLLRDDNQIVKDTNSKNEDYKLHTATDAAPSERTRTPFLQRSASSSYISAIVPSSNHFEILQMDQELKNQKSITLSSIFSGNGHSVAWHSSKNRFAALVSSESRLSRTPSSTAAPKRRGFMFGRSDDSNDPPKQKTIVPRIISLSLFEMSRDGQVETIEDGYGTEDHLVHLFSGPYLGIVRYDGNEDTNINSMNVGINGDESSALSKSTIQNSSESRLKRVESVTITSSGYSTSSSVLTGTVIETEDSTADTRHAFLEFYDWTSPENKKPDNKSYVENFLKKIPCTTIIPCPLAVEWEPKTNQYCALVYHQSIRIYRVDDTTGMTLLHTIPFGYSIKSVKWIQQILFVVTEKEVKSYLICRSRYFSFEIASHMTNNIQTKTTNTFSSWSGDDEKGSEAFPIPQKLPFGATTILCVRNEQLLLTGNQQQLFTLELSNRLFQACVLISIGEADKALAFSKSIKSDLSDWLATVFEAFGFIDQAIQVPGLDLNLKINICIKHNLLPSLGNNLLVLSQTDADSKDLKGTSLFQRGCVALIRSNEKKQLEELFKLAIESKRFHDASFIASLLQNEQMLVDALVGKKEWGPAFYLAKKKSFDPSGDKTQEFLSNWNNKIRLACTSSSPWSDYFENASIIHPLEISLVQ